MISTFFYDFIFQRMSSSGRKHLRNKIFNLFLQEGSMRYRILFLVVVGLFVFGSVYADVPKLINFQGRLTDASGKFVPDGNYSLTFRLYNDSTGGSSKWSEAQLVNVAKGLFNVILGEVTPIPDSIFEYPNAFLGIQVAADPEMTPRQRLSSLGYAYYASNSDKLDGLHASDFTSPVSDFGRSGVAADLYEGSTTMTDKYVNAAGPDSVVASSGTAFLGRAAGSSAVSMYGVAGYTSNASSGGAFGLWGEVASVGTGPWHYAVVGNSYSSSTSTAYTSGVAGFGYASEVGGGYGVLGVGYNTAAGPAFGGYFEAGPDGTGMHYGVRANSYASSAVTTYGSYAYATNASTGNVYGGVFTTSASGTGYHYGVSADAGGNSSNPSYGVDAYASNSSSGNVYGGSFLAASSGTGLHCGTRSIGYGASSSSTTAPITLLTIPLLAMFLQGISLPLPMEQDGTTGYIHLLRVALPLLPMAATVMELTLPPAMFLADILQPLLQEQGFLTESRRKLTAVLRARHMVFPAMPRILPRAMFMPGTFTPLPQEQATTMELARRVMLTRT